MIVMTQAQKLEALIRKAVENDPQVVDWTFESITEDGSFLKVRDNITGQIQLMDAWRFLCLHKVARALFGSWEHEDYEADRWEHHLQAAVISDNPIEYYYKEVLGCRPRISEDRKQVD